MPVFTVEVVEVVVYRGRVEAHNKEEASQLAVEDLLKHSGGGRIVFAEVADRSASVVDE